MVNSLPFFVAVKINVQDLRRVKRSMPAKIVRGALTI